jgi:hypothetical protein
MLLRRVARGGPHIAAACTGRGGTAYARTGVEVTCLDIVACAEQPVQVGSDAFGREELVDPVVHEVEENFAAVEGQQPANQLNGHALEAEGVDERKRRCQLGALLWRSSTSPLAASPSGSPRTPPRQRDLDQGSMSPVAYAPKELTAADEAKIRALVKKAVS